MANGMMLAAYRNQNWTRGLGSDPAMPGAGREFGLTEFYNRYVARIRTFPDSPRCRVERRLRGRKQINPWTEPLRSI